MNMKFAALAVLGTFTLLAMAPARAADNGFYLGAGIVKSEITADDDDSFELDDDSYKIIAGFRPLNWLAFEANYIDLGESTDDFGLTFGGDALAAFALGLYEVGVVDFYAKAGVVQWNVDASLDGVQGSAIDDDDLSFAYGVGVGAHFGSIGVRAEFEKFEIDEPFDLEGASVDSELLSLSVTYTFL